jgi:tyrosinase
VLGELRPVGDEQRLVKRAALGEAANAATAVPTPRSGATPRALPRRTHRVTGVDRLVIPGSFLTTLTADGEPLARQAFFQSTEPRDCGRCRERAKVDITFTVPAEAVLGKNLGAGIEVVAPGAERIGARFPLSRCGDPTLNVRLLLEESP